MRISCLRSLAVLVALASLLSAGCHDERKEALAIKAAQGKYESWLRSRVPFLTNIGPSVLYAYEFSVLKEPSRVRPYITYYLKVGDRDGLIELQFVIDMDAEKTPVGLARKTGSFIRLPPRRVDVDAKNPGKGRNLYCGFLLYPNELETIVERVARGDPLLDLCTQADRGKGVQVQFSRPRDTDDWERIAKK